MARDGRGAQFATWRATIERTLDEVVPRQPAALVNFPHHRNAGDAAIWLAERRSLDRLGRRVAYRGSWQGVSLDALRRRIGSGPVLLNGGGNFGDLYAGQQGLREEVLARCRGNPVVQLPQSIWFRDRGNLDRVRRLIARHGQVTILCRDRRSEAYAREHFEADVRYCPDMALALEPVSRPGPPVTDVLWLARRDPEARVAPPTDPAALDGVEVCDWLAPFPGERSWPDGHRLGWEVVNRSLSLFRRSPRAASAAWWLPAARFDALASAWVSRARRVLARGRVVITDRLHAHILALGMGIPSVALDSSYGKVHDIVRECTGELPGARMAHDADEALALAGSLAGAVGAP